MNILDQWKAAGMDQISIANSLLTHLPLVSPFHMGITNPKFAAQAVIINQNRILALIDLVRKKDEALSYFKEAYRCEIAIWKNGSLSVGRPDPKIFLDALALTKELK